MEFNENQDFIPMDDPIPMNEPEEPVSGAYSGAGVGHRESPYANSPYYSYYHTPPQPEPEPARPVSHEPVDPPRPRQKRKNGMGRRILAAVLSIVLVAASSGITAWVVNEQWEDRAEVMEDAFQQKLDALEADIRNQLDRISSSTTGTSVSGSPTVGGQSPSQVYANNVNSVVAITNVVQTSGWGSQGYTAYGTGSGFILSSDGYIVTNYHVIDGYSKLFVTTYLGDEYEATLVGGDEINDVALLKVDVTGLDPVSIGSSDDLIVGDMVVAIGNPLGELTATQTVGYISGKDRSVSTDGTIINMLQTDAAINSGNSGGPLFNMKGEVVGITTAKYSGQSSSGATIEGIGFAIPINDVMSMLDDFKEYGYVRNQAYLGVEVMDLDATTANMYSLPTGSYVQKVVENGSAHRAGVQVKDIIIAIGEHKVSGNTTLTAALRKFSAGDTTTITVFRAGQEITMSITFDERPGDLNTESSGPSVPGEYPENGTFDDWKDSFFGD